MCTRQCAPRLMPNNPRPSGSTPPYAPAPGVHVSELGTARVLSTLVPRHQAHWQLLCVTRRDLAVLRLSTGAGSSPSVQYSSVELQQPPILRSILPLVWNSSELTAIVIGGER